MYLNYIFEINMESVNKLLWVLIIISIVLNIIFVYFLFIYKGWNYRNLSREIRDTNIKRVVNNEMWSWVNKNVVEENSEIVIDASFTSIYDNFHLYKTLSIKDWPIEAKRMIVALLKHISLEEKLRIVYNWYYNIKFFYNNKYYIVWLWYPEPEEDIYIDIENPNVWKYIDTYFSLVEPLYIGRNDYKGIYKIVKMFIDYYEWNESREKVYEFLKSLRLSSYDKDFYEKLLKDIDYLKEELCDVRIKSCKYNDIHKFNELISNLNIMKRKESTSKITNYEGLYSYWYYEYITLWKLIFLHKYISDLEEAKKFVNRTSFVNVVEKDSKWNVYVDRKRLYQIWNETMDNFIKILSE